MNLIADRRAIFAGKRDTGRYVTERTHGGCMRKRYLFETFTSMPLRLQLLITDLHETWSGYAHVARQVSLLNVPA